jgi:signal transduction histidine kinase
MARDVLETGALFMRFDEYVERYDTLGVQRVAPWTGARAAVPLQTVHGPLGALTFIFEHDREFDEQDRAYFRALGDQCTLALERVRFGQQAEEARVAKAQFLAATSHELRTPLTVILGNLDLLEEGCLGPGPERWQQAISRVHASSGHLLSLVEDLLRFVDVSRGEVRSHHQRCDARDIVNRALSGIEALTDARGIRIVRDLPDEPLLLQTDCVKVEQILTNLVVNAGRFVHEGEIRVAARSDGDTLVVEVSDTGAGIPPEQHDRVFHPFVQMDQSYTRRVGGLGLGLSVARELARFLHGDLTLDTRTSRGTMFRLPLPVRQPAAQPELALAST